MAVQISSSRLISMEVDGVQNNPVVGIDDALRKPGSFTSGGASASRLTDGATYTFWTGSGTTNIVYEMDSEQPIDMMAVAAHNIDSSRSVSAQVWDGSSWVNLAQTSSASETIIWLGNEITTDRVRFVVTSASGDAIIGVAFAGRSYTFDQRFYQGYNEGRYPTNVDLLTNPSGPHVLGTSVLGKGTSINWSIEHLPEDSVYGSDFAMLVDHYNKGKGFFAAWRPADYSTAYFGHREGDAIQLPNSGPKRRKSLEMGMRVYDDY